MNGAAAAEMNAFVRIAERGSFAAIRTLKKTSDAIRDNIIGVSCIVHPRSSTWELDKTLNKIKCSDR